MELKLLGSENFDACDIVDAPMPGYQQLGVIKELESNGHVIHLRKIILFTGLEIPNSTIVTELKIKRSVFLSKKTSLMTERLNSRNITSIPSTKNV